MKQNLQEYCQRTQRDDLLAQWHPDNPLTPAEISYGSKKKFRWQCRAGHTWQAAVYTRTSGQSQCPYCARKKPWPGQNDLASQYPDIAAQWHPTKNNGLTPDNVLAAAHKKVWWVCGAGHEWQAQVKSRTAGGSGCPFCANRAIIAGQNDLAATYPLLASQWHPEKNGPLTPQQVVSGSQRKVWWRCERGHEWQASICSRTAGAGCPICTGKVIVAGENDLASNYPALAAQWVREKNGQLGPEQVSVYSNRRVWWRCQLGHEWQTTVAARTTDGQGCPVCAGRKVLLGFNDLRTKQPQLAEQWHPTLNGSLTPEMVTTGSRKKVWWQCPVGHVWKAVVYSRAGKSQSGCPVCAGRVRNTPQNQLL